jgi:hypothetical protein
MTRLARSHLVPEVKANACTVLALTFFVFLILSHSHERINR